MSSEVLQEFLVKLGYKIDSASANRFSTSLSKMNKGVLGVGAAVAGMAFLAQKSMRDFASEMEDLKYTSQLADSSANSINSMSRAMQQFGFKPGQIEGIMQGFAGMIAASPGLEAMMKSMGVALNPDKAIEFFNVMRKLEAMPEPVAIRTAAEFGVDVQSYRLIRGHIGEMAAEWNKVSEANKRVGNDLDENVKRGREFNNTLRDIANQSEAIADVVLNAFIRKFGQSWAESLKTGTIAFAKWLGGETSFSAMAKESAGEEKSWMYKDQNEPTSPKDVEFQKEQELQNKEYNERLERAKRLLRKLSGQETGPTGLNPSSSKLGETAIDNSTTITNHNTFHIQGTDAKANAREVSKQLGGTSFNEKKVTARNQLGGNS